MSKTSELVGKSHAVPFRASALSRVFDISCATIGLLLLFPLCCVVAIAIKLDDRGPIFYKQARVGRNFQPYQLYKFRSMSVGADRGSLITAPGDSRLTKTGRWLRKYKLDELPQLLNVLNGDMQLVGARPEVERYVQKFHSEYALLLQDRPGITDPASLAYRHEDQILQPDRMEEQYIDEILPAKLRLSLCYQRERDFISDLRIILQTLHGLVH